MARREDGLGHDGEAAEGKSPIRLEEDEEEMGKMMEDATEV